MNEKIIKMWQEEYKKDSDDNYFLYYKLGNNVFWVEIDNNCIFEKIDDEWVYVIDTEVTGFSMILKYSDLLSFNDTDIVDNKI